jgi:hypothetical protein
VLQEAQVNGLCFRVAANGEAEGWSWIHPGLSIGCGYCSDLQVKLEPGKAGAVAGEAFSASPQSFQSHHYEFRARFNAGLAAPPAANKK